MRRQRIGGSCEKSRGSKAWVPGAAGPDHCLPHNIRRPRSCCCSTFVSRMWGRRAPGGGVPRQWGQRKESPWKGRKEANVQALWFLQVRQFLDWHLSVTLFFCSHLDHTSCPHSEWRGRNPVNSSGLKLSCSYCRSTLIYSYFQISSFLLWNLIFTLSQVVWPHDYWLPEDSHRKAWQESCKLLIKKWGFYLRCLHHFIIFAL